MTGLRESLLERLFARAIAVPAGRFLRMKRSVNLRVRESDGRGVIADGRYQSPILVQWHRADRGTATHRSDPHALRITGTPKLPPPVAEPPERGSRQRKARRDGPRRAAPFFAKKGGCLPFRPKMGAPATARAERRCPQSTAWFHASTRRISPDGFVQHVINRGDHRETIFPQAADFRAFLGTYGPTPPWRPDADPGVLHHAESLSSAAMALPRKSIFLRTMQLLMNLHIQRYLRHYPSASPGHIYQGRYTNVARQPGAGCASACMAMSRPTLRGWHSFGEPTLKVVERVGRRRRPWTACARR